MKKTLKEKIKDAKASPEMKPFPARFECGEFDLIAAEAKRQNISINAFIRVACREAVETLSKKRTG